MNNIPLISRIRIFLGGLRRFPRQPRTLSVVAFLLCGGRVRGGVFNGMRLELMARKDHPMSAKYIGTFEAELIPVFAWATTCDFTDVINIGSAEGYYAVGVAFVSPEARIIAFEQDTQMHSHLAANASHNGVQDRINQRGIADVASLRACLTEITAPFLIVDIEGGELSVLDPSAVPELDQAFMIVELHLHVHPELIEVMRSRFAKSHRLWLFEPQDWTQLRDGNGGTVSFHWLSRWSEHRDEHRSPGITPWLLMAPVLGRAVPQSVTRFAKSLC